MAKPIVFISHIHEDKATAGALEELIKDSLVGAVNIFNTSNRRSLEPGDPWRDEVIEALRTCIALLVIATPSAVTRPWINFESGGAWVSQKRVIPCCAKGMQKSSLPPPLSHLQGINLADSHDLKQLIEGLANAVSLDAPTRVDYGHASSAIESTWTTLSLPGGDDLDDWLRRVSVRPRKYVGETHKGTADINRTDAVSPVESKQFPDEQLIAGDSIRCSIQTGSTLRVWVYCFASGDVADSIAEVDLPSEFEISLKVIGHIKTFATEWEPIEEPDRGVEYYPAFLLTDARRTRW